MTAADTLTSDRFLAAVAAMNEEFVGTAADLRSKLTPEGVRRLPDDWPKSARAVTGLLKRNAPVLRKAGWTVVDVLDRHAKILTWTLTPLQQRVGGNNTRNPHKPRKVPLTSTNTLQVVAGMLVMNSSRTGIKHPQATDTAPATSHPHPS